MNKIKIFGNSWNEEKYWQIIYLTKDSHSGYIKNTYNSITTKKPNNSIKK